MKIETSEANLKIAKYIGLTMSAMLFFSRIRLYIALLPCLIAFAVAIFSISSFTTLKTLAPIALCSLTSFYIISKLLENYTGTKFAKALRKPKETLNSLNESISTTSELTEDVLSSIKDTFRNIDIATFNIVKTKQAFKTALNKKDDIIGHFNNTQDKAEILENAKSAIEASVGFSIIGTFITGSLGGICLIWTISIAASA